MTATDLEGAVATHVRPGDTVYVAMGHHRWTAAARELARQHWGHDSQLTLVMASLSSLGALLFRGGCVRRVVTCYSGDSFPTYTPNPIYQEAYTSGTVAVEHWSFLSFVQRLRAAAQGHPAAVTTSLRGSSMAANDGYREIETDTGPAGLVTALHPDVTLMHAAAADRAGNVALAPPLLDAHWGAMAARRGAVVTVERIVDDLRAAADLVRIPAHRVLAVIETPFGAHPGGLHGHPQLPVDPYGEDIDFWVRARDAGRGDFDAWARRWCLEPATHDDYLARLGDDRLRALRERSDPESWRADAAAHPVDEDAPVSDWERAAAWAARELAARVDAVAADAVLAGAGVANLAAWVGVDRARADGTDVALTAELGLWGYEPTPADPFIFNFRSFPSATMLGSATDVLGTLVAGPGTRVVGMVGAAQVDRRGNLNSTLVPDGPFLVGSGGANDVVTSAEETVVVTLLRPVRTPAEVGYVTCPGQRVRTVVTDRGILRKHDGVLRLAAVPAGAAPIAERARAATAACGWDLEVARDLDELPAPTAAEVHALRDYDRRRLFLGE